MPLLILVGLPSVGKSSVGRDAARRLGVDFVDVDAYLERRLGQTIRAFFDTQGEAAFRQHEAAAIAELCAAPAGVIATGGGAVLRADTCQRLRAAGTVVYLHAAPEMLVHRLRRDTTRPLLQGVDPLAKLRQLYAERDPLYRACAHWVVNAGRLARPVLTSRVLMQLELGRPPARARGRSKAGGGRTPFAPCPAPETIPPTPADPADPAASANSATAVNPTTPADSTNPASPVAPGRLPTPTPAQTGGESERADAAPR